MLSSIQDIKLELNISSTVRYSAVFQWLVIYSIIVCWFSVVNKICFQEFAYRTKTRDLLNLTKEFDKLQAQEKELEKKLEELEGNAPVRCRAGYVFETLLNTASKIKTLKQHCLSIRCATKILMQVPCNQRVSRLVGLALYYQDLVQTYIYRSSNLCISSTRGY